MANSNIPVSRHEGTLVGREETRTPESFVRPAVDIFETEAGLTLLADLPGVTREGLEINIDKGILAIKGNIDLGAAGNELYREFALANYYRQFQLPDEIDSEKARAELKDGVLKLELPKAEAAKPRRIEITAH